MIKKRVKLSESIKNRIIGSWQKNTLYDYISKSGEEYDLFTKAFYKFKDKFIHFIESNLLDDQTRRLYKENSQMFNSSSYIFIEPSSLGIDVSAFDIPLDVPLRFDYEMPFGGYRVTIGKEELEKFPETDLNILKDLCFEVFNAAYKARKKIYREDKKTKILEDVNTVGQLFRYDTTLYEVYVKKHFSASYLEYEEYDDGVPAESKSDLRKKVKTSNKSVNEKILEELKTKIKL